jgi:hypothetical protein
METEDEYRNDEETGVKEEEEWRREEETGTELEESSKSFPEEVVLEQADKKRLSRKKKGPDIRVKRDPVPGKPRKVSFLQQEAGAI